MKEQEEQARWVALLAQLECLRKRVAAVEAAYRGVAGPSRTTALLRAIGARVDGDLGPFARERARDAARTDADAPRLVP